MLSINSIVFFVGILLLIGIASSKFSARIGMPVLVLFLGVGMLAGSEGLGGIAFEGHRLDQHLAPGGGVHPRFGQRLLPGRRR